MSANGDMSLDYKQACETVACLDYSALRGNMPCTSVVVHTRITANTIISSTVIFLKECRSRSVSRGFLRGGMRYAAPHLRILSQEAHTNSIYQ